MGFISESCFLLGIGFGVDLVAVGFIVMSVCRCKPFACACAHLKKMVGLSFRFIIRSVRLMLV